MACHSNLGNIFQKDKTTQQVNVWQILPLFRQQKRQGERGGGGGGGGGELNHLLHEEELVQLWIFVSSHLI